jgi:hypothetical protein
MVYMPATRKRSHIQCFSLFHMELQIKLIARALRIFRVDRTGMLFPRRTVWRPGFVQLLYSTITNLYICGILFRIRASEFLWGAKWLAGGGRGASKRASGVANRVPDLEDDFDIIVRGRSSAATHDARKSGGGGIARRPNRLFAHIVGGNENDIAVGEPRATRGEGAKLHVTSEDGRTIRLQSVHIRDAVCRRR